MCIRDSSVKINELEAQLQQLNGEKDKLGNQIYVSERKSYFYIILVFVMSANSWLLITALIFCNVQMEIKLLKKELSFSSFLFSLLRADAP